MMESGLLAPASAALPASVQASNMMMIRWLRSPWGAHRKYPIEVQLTAKTPYAAVVRHTQTFAAPGSGARRRNAYDTRPRGMTLMTMSANQISSRTAAIQRLNITQMTAANTGIR